MEIRNAACKFSFGALASALCLAITAAGPAAAPARSAKAGRSSAGASPQSGTSSPRAQQPPKEWIDADTGHRVVRVSDEPGSGSLYFNLNAYTGNHKEMVYSAPDGIHAVDLATWKTRRVVEGRAFIIEAGKKSQNVYYMKPDRWLYATDVDTGATRKIAQAPAQGGISTINADETLAAGTYIEGEIPESLRFRRPGGPSRPGGQAPQGRDNYPGKGQMMERTLAAHLPRVLFTLNLQTGERKILLHSTDWLNHLLFSPTDPALLMYCHEGPWHKVDRIWTIRTDGTHNTLVHKRTMEMEIAGHEFWGWGGKTVWYDLQTPKGEDFWLAGYRVDTGERTWYHLQRNEWSIHFNVSADGALFAGDGGDPGQVAHAPDGEWIYLFHPQLINDTGIASPDLVRPGVLHSERVVNMSKHNYHLEPNVRFTPDAKWIVFRSNMFGPEYVFAVEVAKAGQPQ